MKIACFSMLRNESLLIEPFINQASEFFDYLYILDHASTDNTIEIINKQNNQNIQLFFLNSTGYPQSEVTTFFARKILNETDAEYLFLLDADEYLPFSNRQELDTFLLKHRESDIIKMHWCNLYPADLNSNDIFSGNFSYSDKSKMNAKVILSKSIHKIANWQVAQGNHSILIDIDSTVTVVESELPLYHIPIQNITQLYLKMLSGAIRLQGSKILRMKGLGSHWEIYAKFISSHSLTQNDLMNMIFYYGESIPFSIQPKRLNFTFPYITKRQNDTYNINGHLIGIIQQVFNTSNKYQSANYIITDSFGTIIDKISISYPEWLFKLACITIRNSYFKIKAFVKNYLYSRMTKKK
jgi:hypothetical protein